LKLKAFFKKHFNKKRLKDAFKFNRRLFAFPYVFVLAIFVLLPLFFILGTAFQSKGGGFTFSKVGNFFTDGVSLPTLWKSIWVGGLTTLICLAVGYPVAYFLASPEYNKSNILMLLFILPMWINLLLRTLATKTLFAVLNIPLGQSAVLFGMVYNFLPFMILPIYTVLTNIDKSYIEGARDLGANGAQVFLKVTLPLSVPGIISGITMVFVPTISTYVISTLLSEGNFRLFGDLINYDFIKINGDRGLGSVMSIVMLLIVVLFNFVLNKFAKDDNAKGGVW